MTDSLNEANIFGSSVKIISEIDSLSRSSIAYAKIKHLRINIRINQR
jgi:hypothetical protein